MNPPLVPTVFVARVVPSGFRMETLTLVIVTPVRLRLTRWFSTPVNVYFAFWPGAVVVTVKGVPGVIVPLRSAGTVKRFTSALPTFACCGSSRILY